MKFIISGKHINVTDALKEKAVSKIGKISKFFHEDTEAHITMSVQKKTHIIEVTIPFQGHVLRAEERNNDMYAAIDKVTNILERQIVRNKSKLTKKVHENIFRSSAFDSEDDFSEDNEDEFNIVRSKKFPVKPMAVEEAVLQMDLLSHEFFVFSNDETKKVNVVYKRKDGNYGLIEPEF